MEGEILWKEEMVSTDKEIDEMGAIEDIIRNSLVCRLGLAKDDRPYVVPLCFGHRDDTLYFHSAPEGQKIEILKSNPNVCFEFDIDQELIPGETPCRWAMKYRSVIGFGKGSLVHDLTEKRVALDLIVEHYSGRVSAYDEAALEGIAVIKVEIESMTGRVSGY